MFVCWQHKKTPFPRLPENPSRFQSQRCFSFEWIAIIMTVIFRIFGCAIIWFIQAAAIIILIIFLIFYYLYNKQIQLSPWWWWWYSNSIFLLSKDLYYWFCTLQYCTCTSSWCSRVYIPTVRLQYWTIWNQVGTRSYSYILRWVIMVLHTARVGTDWWFILIHSFILSHSLYLVRVPGTGTCTCTSTRSGPRAPVPAWYWYSSRCQHRQAKLLGKATTS